MRRRLGGHGVLALVTVVAGLLAAAAAASAASWWPAVPVVPGQGMFGVAANAQGGMLVLAQGQPALGTYDSAHSAFCGPAGESHYLAGVLPSGATGDLGQLASGSPMFRPDGTAVAVGIEATPFHGRGVYSYEAPAGDPRDLRPVQRITMTSSLGGGYNLISAQGAGGDLAAAVLSYSGESEAAGEPADQAGWWKQALPNYTEGPRALAVDGKGDVTLLDRTLALSAPHEVVASAYFAPPGGPFRELAVPGSFFTAIASDASGRTALAGYDANGPQGPGLYLSRRESPSQSFGPLQLVGFGGLAVEPQLAYDAAGELTIVWVQENSLLIAEAAPGRPAAYMEGFAVPSSPQFGEPHLAVAPSDEAVVAWAGAPNVSAVSSEGLQGVPTPIFASVRAAGAADFASPTQLTAAAQATEQGRAPGTTRISVAMAAGRAMVAWPQQEPSGPEIESSLYANSRGCLAASPPPTPPVQLRATVSWSRHPRRHRRTVTLGRATCSAVCTATIVLRANVRRHRWRLGSGRLGMAANKRTALVAHLTRQGVAFLRAHRHATLLVELTFVQPGSQPDRLSRILHLAG